MSRRETPVTLNHIENATGSDQYGLLASGLRRHVVALLTRSETGCCTVEEVLESALPTADEPTDGGNSDVEERIGITDRERLRVRLYHVDLPKLRAGGVVDYDWRSGDIVLTDEGRDFVDGSSEATA